MSCGEICKYITEKYHVTAITSMNEGKSRRGRLCKNTGCLSCAAAKRGQNASGRVGNGRIGSKGVVREEIPFGLEAEGYFPHGVRASASRRRGAC